VDPADIRTLSLRDPAITDGHGRSRGLLRSVKVHESVINRIATGTDRYAPISLPKTFAIVPPQDEGETVQQPVSPAPVEPAAGSARKSMLDRRVRARLTDPSAADAREAATDSILNLVWWRRLTYFATLAATLMLLALPLVAARLPSPPVLADGRTWIGGVIRLLSVILPSFAGQWVEVYADNPFYFLVLAGVILLLLAFGTRMERTLRDEARRVWRLAVNGEPIPEPAPSWVRRFRNSGRYQRFVRRFKWYFLPDWVIAPAAVITACWILFAAYVQAALPFLENGTALCQPSTAAPLAISRVARDFRTDDVCAGSFGHVTEATRYVVTFDVVEPWRDSSLATTPEGLASGEFPWGLGYIAGPFKRVIGAHYLQPLIEIRPIEPGNVLSGNIQIYPLAVRQVGDTRTRFRGDFKAARSGELYLFVNDAMLPFTSPRWGKYDYHYFYKSSGRGDEPGNHGTACVTIESGDAERGATPLVPASPICQAASRRMNVDTVAASGPPGADAHQSPP
jgi:hypothetical protein